jgi:hypothetical protein
MYATAQAVTTIFTTVNFGNEGAPIDPGLMGGIEEHFVAPDDGQCFILR